MANNKYYERVLVKCNVCGKVHDNQLEYGLNEEYPDDMFIECNFCDNTDEGTKPQNFEIIESYYKSYEREIYRVVDYFDVWGNPKDGFEVNNLATVGEIEVKDYTDTKEIIQALKELGFLAKHVRTNMFEVLNDYEFIEFFRKNGKPVFRLELVRK